MHFLTGLMFLRMKRGYFLIGIKISAYHLEVLPLNLMESDGRKLLCKTEESNIFGLELLAPDQSRRCEKCCETGY